MAHKKRKVKKQLGSRTYGSGRVGQHRGGIRGEAVAKLPSANMNGAVSLGVSRTISRKDEEAFQVFHKLLVCKNLHI